MLSCWGSWEATYTSALPGAQWESPPGTLSRGAVLSKPTSRSGAGAQGYTVLGHDVLLLQERPLSPPGTSRQAGHLGKQKLVTLGQDTVQRAGTSFPPFPVEPTASGMVINRPNRAATLLLSLRGGAAPGKGCQVGWADAVSVALAKGCGSRSGQTSWACPADCARPSLNTTG